MSKCHNILPTITSSFISSAGMTERVNEFRMKLFAWLFLCRWQSCMLHVAVFTKHDILNFWDNVNLLKYYPVKVPKNYFNSLIVQIKQLCKFPNFRSLGKWKEDLKFCSIVRIKLCAIFWRKSQLMRFVKRMPLSISIINLKIELLIG